MYASLLGISDALHLDVFDQPAMQVLFSNLLGFTEGRWHGDHESHGRFLEFCQSGPFIVSRFLIIRRKIFLKRMKQGK